MKRLEFESNILKDLSDEQYTKFMSLLDDLLDRSLDREIVTHSKYIGIATFTKSDLIDLILKEIDTSLINKVKDDYEYSELLYDIVYAIDETVTNRNILPKFYDYIESVQEELFEEENDFKHSDKIEYVDISKHYEVDTTIDNNEIKIEVTYYTKDLKSEIAEISYQIESAKYKNWV